MRIRQISVPKEMWEESQALPLIIKTDEAGSSFNIQNCKNSGNLSSTTTNGYIGGILAVDGFMQTQTTIDSCENSGTISFTKSWVMQENELKTEK